jgi:hypothetical protein
MTAANDTVGQAEKQKARQLLSGACGLPSLTVPTTLSGTTIDVQTSLNVNYFSL